MRSDDQARQIIKGAVVAVIAAAALFWLLHKPNSRDLVVGNWRLEVHGPDDDMANRMGLKVRINADGTFLLTGAPQFEGLAGAREIHGRYAFKGEAVIHAEMDGAPFDYQPTDFSMKVMSRNQLVLSAEDYSVGLKRL